MKKELIMIIYEELVSQYTMYLTPQPKNGQLGIKNSDRISRIYKKVSLDSCSYMNHTYRPMYVQSQEKLRKFLFLHCAL